MKDMQKLKKEFFTLLRYGAVGLVNTGVTAAVIFLVKLTGIHYTLYTMAGYIVGISVSFILNRRFTFKKHNEKAGLQAIKFISVTAVLLMLTQFLQYILIDIAGFNETLGVLTGMVFYTGIGYVLNRFFVFK